jgi:hypothetical protein
MKAILLFVAGIAAVGFVIHSSSSSRSDKTSSDAAASTGVARLQLEKNASYCRADPLDARLYVYVTFRNTGTARGTVSVTPWRRYSDGTTNDSVMDMFQVTVPAHKFKTIYGAYDYNAQQHDLLECGVYVGSNLRPTPIRVAS